MYLGSLNRPNFSDFPLFIATAVLEIPSLTDVTHLKVPVTGQTANPQIPFPTPLTNPKAPSFWAP